MDNSNMNFLNNDTNTGIKTKYQKNDYLTTIIQKKTIALLKKLGVPGAVVSINSKTYGNIEILYGHSNIEKRTPMSTKLIYPIGSVTKTFTGTMFLQAYDEDLVDLDKNINSCFVGVPNGKYIKVREIGNMTSGLFNYTESPAYDDINESDPYRIWSTMELILLGLTNPVYFPSGSDIHYSNTNSIILGASLENIYGKQFYEILQERMIKPLGLQNTTFNSIVPKDGVTGYIIKDGQYNSTIGYNYSWAWCAGQMLSNVDDMHKYARTSIGKHKTISKNAAKQQRKWISYEVIAKGVAKRYGFHMVKLNNYIGHNGNLPGFSTYVLCNNASKTTIVIMCNLQFTEFGLVPANEIANYIVRALPGY
jgi:D-alanyl-D-alanine carboxypeptidase